MAASAREIEISGPSDTLPAGSGHGLCAKFKCFSLFDLDNDDEITLSADKIQFSTGKLFASAKCAITLQKEDEFRIMLCETPGRFGLLSGAARH
nr:hypothetical protein [Ponticaulis sp.]